MTSLRFNYRWALAVIATAVIALTQSLYSASSAHPLAHAALAQAQRNPTPTPTPERRITIEETIERREGDNKIVFKPEFELINQSATGAMVSKKSVGTDGQPTRVIVGDVDCVCTPKPGGGSGSCKFKVEGTTATCIEGGGCTCKLGLKTKTSS